MACGVLCSSVCKIQQWSAWCRTVGYGNGHFPCWMKELRNLCCAHAKQEPIRSCCLYKYTLIHCHSNTHLKTLIFPWLHLRVTVWAWLHCWDHPEWWSALLLTRSYPIPLTDMASKKAVRVQIRRHNLWHFRKRNAAYTMIHEYPHWLDPGWGSKNWSHRLRQTVSLNATKVHDVNI